MTIQFILYQLLQNPEIVKAIEILFKKNIYLKAYPQPVSFTSIETKTQYGYIIPLGNCIY